MGSTTAWSPTPQTAFMASKLWWRPSPLTRTRSPLPKFLPPLSWLHLPLSLLTLSLSIIPFLVLSKDPSFPIMDLTPRPMFTTNQPLVFTDQLLALDPPSPFLLFPLATLQPFPLFLWLSQLNQFFLMSLLKFLA